MIFYNKVHGEWDGARYVIVSRDEPFEYNGPIAEAKPGKSDAQKQAESQSKADAAKQGQLTDTAQGTLSQFEGPVQNSPFYNALLTTNTEATSNAYQNAQRNVRARANQAGFGYNQPVEQGAEAGVGAEEASALARVPGQTMVEATGPALRAAGETAGIGSEYGREGLGYTQAAGQMDAQRNSLWQALLGAGGQVGGALAGRRWGTTAPASAGGDGV